jgi:hypothetical protein
MLWGLLLGNWIDLDHIYLRLIGRVPWFSSACESFGQNCSIGVYPLHNWTLAFSSLAVGGLIFHEDKRLKLVGWLGIGTFLAVFLDYIHMVTGFAF